MNLCPTLEELEALAADTGETREGWEHIRCCSSCRGAIERIRRNNADIAELAALLAPSVRTPPSSTPALPTIQGYKLLAELRSGGQGVVYKVLHEATHRVVALKVLHGAAFASPPHRARFEREINLVAHLHHSNIVTLFDSGTTSDGRLYYTMEYLHGAPIDAWASGASDTGDVENRPGLREKLELFCKVCAAVNHAHQRGVIHRDLKPGNILVDGNGEPHILDFGLAKVPGAGTLGLQGALTLTGEFMGTLHYAAPEQVRGNPDLVDIRADVYSLGIILYEMLTGTHPFSGRGSVKEVLDAITGTDPDPPSRALQSCASAASHDLDEDLDTIVLTAVAREPDRRYHSAEALRLDVTRYLAGEPIEARRASAWYVLRKTVGRYRVALIATTAAVLTLAVFSLVTLTLYQRAVEERRRADLSAARSERVVDFLNDLFRSADAFQTEGRPIGADVSLREVLSLGAAQLRGGLGDEPLIRARLLETLGATFLGLDELDLAEPLVRQALLLTERLPETTPADQTRLLTLQGRIAYERMDYTGAERWYREALARLEPEDSAASAELRDGARFHLAVTLEAKGEADEAERLHQQVLASREVRLGRSHRDVAESLNALGLLAYGAGRQSEALDRVREAYDIRRAVLNPAHPDLQESLNNVAVLLELNGRKAEARPMYEQALDQARATFGPQHQYVASILVNLADLLDSEGSTSRAESCYLEAIRVWKASRGTDNALFLFNYAEFLRQHGRLEEAQRRHRESLALRERTLSADHLDIARSRLSLASTLRELGRWDEAKAELDRAAPRLNRPDSGVLKPLADLLTGRILLDRGLAVEAEPLLERAQEAFVALGADDRLIGETALAHGQCLLALERASEAAKAFRHAVDLLTVVYGPRHERVREALEGVEDAERRVAGRAASREEAKGPD